LKKRKDKLLMVLDVRVTSAGASVILRRARLGVVNADRSLRMGMLNEGGRLLRHSDKACQWRQTTLQQQIAYSPFDILNTNSLISPSPSLSLPSWVVYRK
jgi:hypothetical protein